MEWVFQKITEKQEIENTKFSMALYLSDLYHRYAKCFTMNIFKKSLLDYVYKSVVI